MCSLVSLSVFPLSPFCPYSSLSFLLDTFLNCLVSLDFLFICHSQIWKNGKLIRTDRELCVLQQVCLLMGLDNGEGSDRVVGGPSGVISVVIRVHQCQPIQRRNQGIWKLSVHTRMPCTRMHTLPFKPLFPEDSCLLPTSPDGNPLDF